LAQELSWGSDILDDLDTRFFALIDTNKLTLAGMEAYENKAPLKIPLISARVVEKASAARYFGSRTLIADSDHSSIVKPETTSCQSHETLLDFVKEKELVHQTIKSIFDYPSLFDRYKPEHEEFFISRTADNELKNLMANYSIWICGESGVGKTVSITRRLAKLHCQSQYISLGACIGASFNELLNEIYLTLLNDDERDCPELSDADCVKKISELIRLRSGIPFYLFIEEIPINDEKMFLQFSDFIYAIISAVNEVTNFRMVLSSIFCPNTKFAPEMKKVAERLKIYMWPAWSEKDMEKLADILEKDTGINIRDDKQLCDFQGVPRNMKIYCRDKLSRI